MNGHEQYSSHQLASISAGLEEIAAGQVQFQGPGATTYSLMQLWGLDEQPPADLYAPTVREARRAPAYEIPLREAAPTPPGRIWDLGPTHEFLKAIHNIDKKLQGRILQALTYISTKPTVPRGNTVKPLTGELKGLWRYRIGDHRLIYQPDMENRRVVLVAFAGRGSAYA